MNENEEFEFRHRLEQEQQANSQPLPPSFIDKAADISSRAQNAVLGPIAKGGEALARGASRFYTGSELPAEYAMKGIGAVTKGISDAGDYIAEKGGEIGAKYGYPKTGQVAGVALGAIAQNAPYMLIPEMKGIPGGRISAAAEGLATKAENSASSRWFKGMGGTLSHAKELGADETLRIGRTAKDKGIITTWNSPEAQQAKIEQLSKESGQRIEGLRGLGDLYGNSPEAKKIVQVIHQDVSPKYKTGIKSGEQGDLQKAIEEVLNLEPVDKLTPTEEMMPYLDRNVGTVSGEYPVSRTAIGKPTEIVQNPNYPMAGPKMIEKPNPSYQPEQTSRVPFESTPYEDFRRTQEDPSYIPEYDLHRPTTFNSVANVATKLNKHAKSKSQLLQPSGADTDVANVVSRLNDESLMKSLPPEKGAEYQANLKDYADLSKLDKINEQRLAYEVGGSRNSIVNNLANRIYHKFGHQLSASALDAISGIIRSANNSSVRGGIATAGARTGSKALIEEYIRRKSGDKNGAR